METRNIGGAEFLVWYGRKKLGKNPTCRFEIVLPSLHPLAFLASSLDGSLLLSSCLFFYFLQLFDDFSPRFSLFLCLYQKVPISFLSLPDAIFHSFLMKFFRGCTIRRNKLKGAEKNPQILGFISSIKKVITHYLPIAY